MVGNRKVVEILKGLPLEELDMFLDFLESPIHNRSEILTRFGGIIVVHIKETTISILEVEELFNELKPRAEFSKNYINKLFNGLAEKLFEFLAVSEFLKEKMVPQTYILKAMNRFQLDSQIPSVYKKGEKWFERAKEVDDELLEAKYQFEKQYGVFKMRQSRIPNGHQLRTIFNAFQIAYHSQYFELVLASINQGLMFNDISLQAIINSDDLLISRQKLPDHELVLARHLAIEILSITKDVNVIPLLGVINHENSRISRSIRFELHVITLNYYLMRANVGEKGALANADKLYVSLLENGHLDSNGKIPDTHFKNLIAIRAKLGKISWASEFFEEYKSRLVSATPNLALKYNQSIIHFYQKSYTKAIRLLEEIIGEFKDDIHYGLDARSFLLMSYFERNDPDDSYLIEARSNAFRVFLIRANEISENNRTSYKNFVFLFKKLYLFRFLPSVKRRSQVLDFQNEIRKKPIPNKDWFFRMLESIM